MNQSIYRPRPRPLDVVVVDGDPLTQITIYEELTLLTRRQGGRWSQYPIDPQALAQVLAGVPVLSGLLPPHTLGTGRVYGQDFFAVYVPPTVRTLRMEVAEYTIPLPPLVWAGCGTDYRIWALGEAEHPASVNAPLFVAPFPNCYRTGGVCWGTSDPRPAASAASLLGVLKLFLEESYFNLHLADHKSLAYPNSVAAQWQQLADAGATAYPLDDLVPAECQLAWVLSGQPWAGGK